MFINTKFFGVTRYATSRHVVRKNSGLLGTMIIFHDRIIADVDMEISIKLIESVLIPKILKILENIQKDAITLTTSMPKSTPYEGVLYEC